MIEKERDINIDTLKLLTALLITNSHIAILYPENLKMLSTGGVIGSALFFFCSRYTLF